MSLYKAVVLEMFGSPEDLHYPGSGLDLMPSEEHPGYYWIIKNGKQTRDLVGNGSLELFRIIEEMKKAS